MVACLASSARSAAAILASIKAFVGGIGAAAMASPGPTATAAATAARVTGVGLPAGKCLVPAKAPHRAGGLCDSQLFGMCDAGTA